MKSTNLLYSVVLAVAASSSNLNAQSLSISPSSFKKVGSVPQITWSVTLPTVVNDLSQIVDISTTGVLTPNVARNFTVKTIAAPVTNGTVQNVKAEMQIGASGSWVTVFNGKDSRTQTSTSTSLLVSSVMPLLRSGNATANTEIRFRANTAISSTTFQTGNSSQVNNVKVFKDGQAVPTLVGYQNQLSLLNTPGMATYYRKVNHDNNAATPDITVFNLTKSEAVVIFELVSTNTNDTAGGYDLNDYVAVVTFDASLPPATYTNTCVETALDTGVERQRITPTALSGILPGTTMTKAGSKFTLTSTKN
jgi:hypothetical protein